MLVVKATSLGETVTSNRIVVGVDGSAGARSALLWAADECRVRRQMLLVVHAPDLADADAMAPAIRSLDEIGERMLSEHAAAASARQPSVVVTTLLAHIPAADELIALSADSELVVVGTHGRGGIISSILGSVSCRVAAHAHCPVAVVPERRMPRRDVRPPRVVVGMSAATSGQVALEFAFDEAQRRGATLVAVQASGVPDSSERLHLAAVARVTETSRSSRYWSAPSRPTRCCELPRTRSSSSSAATTARIGGVRDSARCRRRSCTARRAR
jgi:nucleotide-binding universal stress UspA family protein